METVKYVPFQSLTASATGNGTPQIVANYNSLAVQIVISGTGTVNFECTVDGSNWVNLLGTLVGNTTTATSATASAAYQFNVSGLNSVRMRVSANNDAITVTGRMSTASLGGGAGGSGGGSGVTHTDDAAFTPTSDDGVPVFGVFDDAAPDSVDEGDAGAVRMSGNRNLYMRIRDNAGNERGANVNASGELNTSAAVTSVVPGTSATSLGKAEDAAHSSGDTGIMALGVRRDANTSLVDTTGDYAPFQLDANGNVKVAVISDGTGTTLDNDDGSVAAGQTNLALVIPLPYTFDGAAFTRTACSIFRSIDLDETEEEAKATAGVLYGYFFANLNASVRYLKVYNATAASVTVGTTTPVLTLPLPASSSGHVSFMPIGVKFDTAITAAATTGVADNDTGAPGANEVVLNLFYK